jgi:outer membrane protein assembly factor BamB
MNQAWIAKWLPVIAGVAGAVAIALWLSGAANPLKPRQPGADREGGEGTNALAASHAEGKLIKGAATPSSTPGEWPRFRGPGRDNISTDPSPLAKSWPEGGPKKLWEIEVGEGFAAAAISKGRVYVMDYDRTAQADALRCLSLDSGQEIWRYTYPEKIKRNHGMSRTIPTVTDKYVVAITPKCRVICHDPVTGELKWKLDMVETFGTEEPAWYAGQCPYIENDRLILGTGGNCLIAAVDCLTGKVLWRSPNPNRWQMTHSSIAPMDFQGRHLYVYCGSGGVAAVSAEDGKLLWMTNNWKITIANIPTPLPCGDGRVFFSGGYNAGCMMVKLRENGPLLTADTVFKLEAKVFGAEQHTPILYQDHLFGVRPDGQLVCMDLAGKIVWQSGPANRYGKGPYLLAQGMFYLLDDDGTLTLAEASLTGFKQLGKAKVLEGPDAWGPMALAGGRLIVRDNYKMACVDVSGK